MNYKKNINNFSTNLNGNQHFLYKKVLHNLSEEWINLPKVKEKKFYKLYWKLLRLQIKQSKNTNNWTYKAIFNYSNLHNQLYNKKSNSRLNLLKPSSYMYMHMDYTKYNGIRIKGYTSYGEKVLDFKSLDTQLYLLSTYKKLQIYFNEKI